MRTNPDMFLKKDCLRELKYACALIEIKSMFSKQYNISFNNHFFSYSGIKTYGIVISIVSAPKFQANMLNNIYFLKMPSSNAVLGAKLVPFHLHCLSRDQISSRKENWKSFAFKEPNFFVSKLFV